jgi:hypothetical protein
MIRFPCSDSRGVQPAPISSDDALLGASYLAVAHATVPGTSLAQMRARLAGFGASTAVRTATRHANGDREFPGWVLFWS